MARESKSRVAGLAAAVGETVPRQRSGFVEPAQRTKPKLHYRVVCADLHAHLFSITLTIDEPAAGQQVALPVWIPGSYLVREFSKNLQALRASQGKKNVPIAQLDKHSWTIDCKPGKPLVLRYDICAFDNSVRTAWLDPDRGFFNPTSLCLAVEGLTDTPHAIEVVAPELIAGCARWHCATALFCLKADKHGFGSYLAADYDELADSPFELGAFQSFEFDALGVPHRFVVAGAAASFDGEKLIADTKAICETEMRFWHGANIGLKHESKAPHDRYLFLLNAVDDGYGGLEHRHATALICNRRDLPRKGAAKQPEGYTTLQGLISHEYFHTWNVKRLRPFEFTRYDYQRENYTELLWLFEGFTSYYDDLLLRRAGRIDDATYLKLLGKTANGVLQAPGRLVQSVAQASFDAWVKYYRQDAQTPNSTISYYTKGALVALCFDLTLRSECDASLDDVMRLLWERSGGGPITEADFADAVQTVGGRSFAPQIASWIHSTDELPLEQLLLAHGVAALDEPAQPAQALGLRVDEKDGRVQIKVVLRGGAAERAGFAAGDEWIGIELPASRDGKNRKGSKARGAAPAWRLAKLEDLALYLGNECGGEARATGIVAIVARDKRLLRLPLEVPQREKTLRLVVKDEAQLARWLMGS